MNCTVFRSKHREYTYLYLRKGFEYEEVPDALSQVFGEPEFVIDLELSEQRELAQEDVTEVMKNLADRGFHLQMPPGDDRGDLI